MASSLRVNNIMDNLGDKSANFLHAKRIVDTLTNFICSYDERVSSEHVPYRDITSEDSDGDRERLEYFNSDGYKKVIQIAATLIKTLIASFCFENMGFCATWKIYKVQGNKLGNLSDTFEAGILLIAPFLIIFCCAIFIPSWSESCS